MQNMLLSSPKGVAPTSSIPPFSYSGGKRQLASRIVSLCRREFPNEYHLISPFLGGAATELRFMFARRGSCLGADSDRNLVMLWQNLLQDAGAVANHAKSLMPITVDIWREWYADMMSSEWHTAEHAAKYFILRYSKVVHAWNPWEARLEAFNAPTIYRPAFARIARLKAPRLSVQCADFREFLSANDGFCYVDSPYVSDDLSYEKVYEQRGAEDDNIFRMEDHSDLADILSQRTGWIASNSPHEWVKERYRDYQQIEVHVSYMSRSSQQRDNRDTELLIINPM